MFASVFKKRNVVDLGGALSVSAECLFLLSFDPAAPQNGVPDGARSYRLAKWCPELGTGKFSL